jgi:hypothetical protein
MRSHLRAVTQKNPNERSDRQAPKQRAISAEMHRTLALAQCVWVSFLRALSYNYFNIDNWITET